MSAMSQTRPAAPVGTADGHPQVLNRVQRWATVTDPRIVRRLWPAQPDGAQHALCPSCGGTMPAGMLITLNQTTACSRAGPAQQALAVGNIEALTAAMPIEPGELWCVVCLLCLEDRARMLGGLGLTERLHALVAEALRSD